MSSEPLEAARRAVGESDRFQGSAAELRLIRDALRALIQWCEGVEAERGAPSLRALTLTPILLDEIARRGGETGDLARAALDEWRSTE